MTVFDEIRAILQKHKENMPVVATAEILASVDEAEAKWEAELRKHDIEVRNKGIAEFEEQMKFEYRESIGTTKRERHFAEAVIEQVAHSLTEVE